MSAIVEVEAREREWAAAIQRKDIAACGGILAPEYSLLAAGLAGAGWMDRARWLATLRDYDVRAWAFEETRAQEHASVVLFQSRFRQSASVAGVERSGVFLLSDVWAKRDGQWLVVARHSTLVPGP